VSWLTSIPNTRRRDEALPVAEEAVTLRRRLAEANPDAYLPDLAASVNNLAVSLADVGRREEALPVAEEAVTLRRRLAEANPDAYLPDLATSVNNLANRLTDLGRPERIDDAWDHAGTGLPDQAATRWRLLRAGWEWVSTPDYQTERAYLHAHPELLTPGSETTLVHVLNHQDLDQAHRYLTIIDTARRTTIDTAYHELDSG
jgi:tetratricopeptide (TPR) repeat protein